jgi:streptomycin 6-kinase
MLKPPRIMIAVGLPHGESDEDSLNREHDDNGGDDDIATEAIVSIVHNLHRGGPSAVRDLRKFTSALESLCEAFMQKDSHGVEEAASDACDALRDMIGD